jgi:hypothetical protein
VPLPHGRRIVRIDHRGKSMKGQFCAVAVAILALCGAVASADAAKKGAAKSSAKSRSGLAAIQLECFKQHGAWYDEATKRWVMQAPYYIMAGKVDAINDCVAQRAGTKAAPFLQERTLR